MATLLVTRGAPEVVPGALQDLERHAVTLHARTGGRRPVRLAHDDAPHGLERTHMVPDADAHLAAALEDPDLEQQTPPPSIAPSLKCRPVTGVSACLWCLLTSTGGIWFAFFFLAFSMLALNAFLRISKHTWCT